MPRYPGKRVLVTGGVSGMGLATARLLLDEGARVMVTGHTAATLDSARSILGNEAIVVLSDATSISDMNALAARVSAEFGGLDALMVCAGRTRFVPFAQMTADLYDELLAVNAKGPYFLVQEFAPLMTEGGGIVFVTSVADALGIPMISAYAASKAALRSMARSLARELLPRGIRVNAVSPGPINSGILEKSVSKEVADAARKQMTEDNPMKRFGEPEEVARAMMFLAFEATYTTGAEIVVDGGGSQL